MSENTLSNHACGCKEEVAFKLFKELLPRDRLGSYGLSESQQQNYKISLSLVCLQAVAGNREEVPPIPQPANRTYATTGFSEPSAGLGVM
jgi:hypothetical protein